MRLILSFLYFILCKFILSNPFFSSKTVVQAISFKKIKSIPTIVQQYERRTKSKITWKKRYNSHKCGFQVLFRSPALPQDIQLAQKLLIREKMNPFFLSPDNFVVAYQNKVDNQNHPIQTEIHTVLGFGQIRALTPMNEDVTIQKQYYELASLYVLQPYRKKGIGSMIVSELIRKFENENDNLENKTNLSKQLCLLTLAPTVPFYEQFGFQCVTRTTMDDNIKKEYERRIPPPLLGEYALGKLVSKILGNDLVCMVR